MIYDQFSNTSASHKGAFEINQNVRAEQRRQADWLADASPAEPVKADRLQTLLARFQAWLAVSNRPLVSAAQK
jgi:hypothetical protein